MPKGYILSAHRSEADTVKKAAYNLLAKDALEKAGGKIIAMAKVDGNLTVYENGICVLSSIEKNERFPFNSISK